MSKSFSELPKGWRKGLFVTGTDTDVGKTVVSALLAKKLNATYWKVFQTGTDQDLGDAVTVRELFPEVHVEPGFANLAAPLSPLMAARKEGAKINLKALKYPEGADPLIVEGAGGLMVPITEDIMMLDLAAHLNLPIILCARSGLGTINHTLLSVEAVRGIGVPIRAIVLNGASNPDNKTLLEELTGLDIIEIPRFDTKSKEAFAKVVGEIPDNLLD